MGLEVIILREPSEQLIQFDDFLVLASSSSDLRAAPDAHPHPAGRGAELGLVRFQRLLVQRAGLVLAACLPELGCLVQRVMNLLKDIRLALDEVIPGRRIPDVNVSVGRRHRQATAVRRPLEVCVGLLKGTSNYKSSSPGLGTQTRTVPSPLPEATRRPSGDQAIALILAVCNSALATLWPVGPSQTSTRPFRSPETSRCPSGLQVRAVAATQSGRWNL